MNVTKLGSYDDGGEDWEPQEARCPDCGLPIVDCDCEGGEASASRKKRVLRKRRRSRGKE